MLQNISNFIRSLNVFKQYDTETEQTLVIQLVDMLPLHESAISKILSPEQNGRYSADDIVKSIFSKESCCVLISLTLFLGVRLT